MTTPSNPHLPFQTEEEIRNLVAAFESCTLPRQDWDHRAHLTVALWYIARLPLTDATHQIRQSIQKYNHACGIVTTGTSGYHETITRFYVWAVSRYLKTAHSNRSLVELTNGLIESCGDKGLPWEYYSRDLLMSWEARQRWVEPDLKALEE